MTAYKVQSQEALRREMKAVARGEAPAPADAARPSVESADVLMRVLTPENRDALALSPDEQAVSTANLARPSPGR
jgi:predicted transcriptional regulator